MPHTLCRYVLQSGPKFAGLVLFPSGNSLVQTITLPNDLAVGDQ